MTVLRLVPIQVHSAVELLLGLAIMALPFAFGLSAAALVSGVVIGALVVGTALQAIDTDGRPLSISAHHAADYGFAIGMAGAALVMLTTDKPAAVFFGVAAFAQLTLNLVTRYSQR